MINLTPENGVRTPETSHCRRWLSRRVALLIALTLVLSACSSNTTHDLESIGMGLETDLQAGTEFEFTFLAPNEVVLEVASAPTGVDARLEPTSDDGYYQLTVSVAADTPRGAYNLGISVEENGERIPLGWPFDVVDS